MYSAILTKTFHFEAAHHLPGHKGKCARLHGHSYRLEITVRGSIKNTPNQSDSGMVMDFEDLSQIVRNAIIERLDHRDLNEVTGLRTTAENLVHWIWDTLITEGLAATLLYRIRLWETTNSYVEITQEERTQH